MGIILASSILIALERQARGSAAIPSSWLEEEVGIAAITAAELIAGIERADALQRPRRSAFTEGILATIPTVPFDLTAARLHAQIDADLANAGTPIDRADLQIAVTALARGWAVATLNTPDFARVPGLTVIGLDDLEGR